MAATPAVVGTPADEHTSTTPEPKLANPLPVLTFTTHDDSNQNYNQH